MSRYTGSTGINALLNAKLMSRYTDSSGIDALLNAEDGRPRATDLLKQALEDARLSEKSFERLIYVLIVLEGIALLFLTTPPSAMEFFGIQITQSQIFYFLPAVTSATHYLAICRLNVAEWSASIYTVLFRKLYPEIRDLQLIEAFRPVAAQKAERIINQKIYTWAGIGRVNTALAILWLLILLLLPYGFTVVTLSYAIYRFGIHGPIAVVAIGFVALFVGQSLVVLIVGHSPRGDRYKNEPNGFRGIRWGSGISLESDNMTLVRSKDATDYYVRKDDDMSIGKALLNEIAYGYRNGKLIRVEIECVGEDNKSALIEAFHERFDPSSQTDVLPEGTWWMGETTAIFVTPQLNDNKCVVCLASTENLDRSLDTGGFW